MPSAKPTKIRHIFLGMSVGVAVLLYLDRYCLSSADRDIVRDLGFSELQMGALLGAFFLPYAFCQIPFGYLADRFGPRWVLSILMFLWSACTALLGCSTGYIDFYLYRFGCGVFEAGGYPACVGIIKRWIPVSRRGFASGVVSLGGRLGGAITPVLTASLMAMFATLFSRGPDAPPVLFSWQPTLWIFGIAGMVFAVVFWFYFRDNPAEHPACNEAERALILGTPPPAEPVAGPAAATAITAPSPAAITPGVAPPAPAAPASNVPNVRLPVMPLTPFGIMMNVLMFLASIPWRSLVTNANLWCSSFIQFGMNVAMVFVAVYFNRYLTEVHGIDDNVVRSRMISANFIACLPALLVGGWLTDAMVKRFGIRWGIALPMALPRFGAAALIGSVPFLLVAWPEVSLTRAWVVVGIVALASFCADMTLPSVWAFNLAIGGKMVGLVLGWGNMWGNLGGWRTPNDIPQIIQVMGWDAAFFGVAGVHFIIAAAALTIDARDKLKEA